MTPVRVLLALALAAIASLAAVEGPLLDEHQFQVRLERWRALPVLRREVLRQRWRELAQLPGEERLTLQRRLGALDRLQSAWREAQRQPETAEPGRDALRFLLGQVERQARELLAAHARPELQAEARRKTLRRVQAFLGNLVGNGRLAASERERMLALPTDELVRESLELQKRELLALYAEVEGSYDQDELSRLDPVEVVRRLRRVRVQSGLLGPAGRLLQIDAAGQRRIAESLERGETDAVLDELRPHVRALLERRGVAADRIDETLAMPYAELERRLGRLLRPDPDGADASREDAPLR